MSFMVFFSLYMCFLFILFVFFNFYMEKMKLKLVFYHKKSIFVLLV